jgi:predicted AAA+ superfamily ATPase
MNHKQALVFWKEFKIPSPLHRAIRTDLDSDIITTITGSRRAGKTHLCFQIMKAFLDKGIPEDGVYRAEEERGIGFLL